MNSSISNSKRRNASLMVRVVLFTLGFFAVYWLLVVSFNISATFAESNFNAGLIRLQDLRDSEGSVSAIAGTSLFAKLHDDVIFEDSNVTSVNMGIDGGATLFAMKEIVDSNKFLDVLVVEANNFMKIPASNTLALDEATDALLYKLSKYVPLLKREYRPVSVLYTSLKRFKDSMSTSGNNAWDVDVIGVEHPDVDVRFKDDEKEMEKKWSVLIEAILKSGAKIVLVMIPDGEVDRQLEYSFTRKIASKYKLPFIDLKSQLASAPVLYSDGHHLVYGSAHIVSEMIRDAIRKIDP